MQTPEACTSRGAASVRSINQMHASVSLTRQMLPENLSGAKHGVRNRNGVPIERGFFTIVVAYQCGGPQRTVPLSIQARVHSPPPLLLESELACDLL